MKKIAIVLLSMSQLAFISCDKGSEKVIPEVEVSINIPNIDIIYEVSDLSSGRVDELPAGYSHKLSGLGTITFNNINGGLISIDFDGVDFRSQTYTIPVGTYDISISFNDLDVNVAYDYFPFSAFGSQIEITESTNEITLVGSSDYDLIVVENTNLCGDLVGWDNDGSGEFGNSINELRPLFLTNDNLFYYCYIHKDKYAGQSYGNVIIDYMSNDGNCNQIILQVDPVGSKVHYITVSQVSSSNINLDLDNFWTIDSYNVGVG
tara:strand:- start:78920 stop:79708 length:789 start_codon:yes stop_codon:yes gene_type:complete